MSPDRESTEAQIAQKIVSIFCRIERERMADVPVLNKALSVSAIGFQPWNGYTLGILLTPWFMNLMLLPTAETDAPWLSDNVGSKHIQNFPAGKFEFILGHENELGKYLICSVFSPVFEFRDQETAELTAQTVLEEIFRDSSDDEIDERDIEMQQIWAGKLPEPQHPDSRVDQMESGSQSSTTTEEENTTDHQTDDGLEPAEQQYSRRDLLRGLRSRNEENNEVLS